MIRFAQQQDGRKNLMYLRISTRDRDQNGVFILDAASTENVKWTPTSVQSTSCFSMITVRENVAKETADLWDPYPISPFSIESGQKVAGSKFFFYTCLSCQVERDDLAGV
nr:unnamed protein product [Callosobruchus chinensis]